MAADQRRGLGRGLSALLEETRPPAGESEGVREVPIELIKRNESQPRSGSTRAMRTRICVWLETLGAPRSAPRTA